MAFMILRLKLISLYFVPLYRQFETMQLHISA